MEPRVSPNNSCGPVAPLAERLKGYLSRIRRRLRLWHDFLLDQDRGTGHGFASDLPGIDRLRFARLYLGSASLQSTRVRSILGFHPIVTQRLARTHGLVVLSAPLCHQSPSLLKVPRFIQLRLDLGIDETSFFEALPKDRRAGIRRVLAAGFRPEYCTDPGWSEEFHDFYHRPAVRSSHGDEGYVMTSEQIRHSIAQEGAEFLRICLDSQCVAAGTAMRCGDTYQLCRPGWLHGDPAWLRRGVQVARIWFAAQRARELGCRFLALGGTPPFVDDGVFQFKFRWHPRLDMEGSRWGHHHLLMDPRHAGVQRFVRSHPLLAWDEEGRLILCAGHGPASLNLPRQLLQQLAGFWRLVSPEEAAERRLRLGPIHGRPSGWWVPEPWCQP
jgi:Acetyltransferase (GNAT) domain